jgi:hypothetical protein
LSRFLSEALGQNEPKFKQAIMAEERRSGHPSNDIRLSTKVFREVRAKIVELGLDPSDTTAEELYYALNHKLAYQEKLLNKYLRSEAAKSVNAEANTVDGILELVKKLDDNQVVLALKSSVLKNLIKQNPPKKVMKVLGYRSIDSMLKLEPAQMLTMAINLYESEAYISNFYLKHKKFSAADFESRKLSVTTTKSPRWVSVLEEIKNRTGLSIVSDYEMASIILLPVDNQPQSGYLSVVMANLISEMSIIYSVSSYLKLNLLSRDFSSKLINIIEHEPYLEATAIGNKISYRAAQHKLKALDSSPSPHVTLEDIEPVNMLEKLGDIFKEFKFWQDSEFLAFVEQTEAISLNILDVASNLANNLPFHNRSVEHLRHSLTQELNKMYLSTEDLLDSLYLENNTREESLVGM